MNRVEKLLKEYGLVQKSDLNFNSLKEDLEVKTHYFVKQESDGKYVSLKEQSARLMKKLFFDFGKIALEDTELFSKKFNVTFENEPYPQWFLEEFCFRIEQRDYDELTIAIVPVRLKTIYESFMKSMDKTDPFTQTKKDELKLKTIFNKDETQEIINLIKQETLIFIDKVLASEDAQDFVDDLKDAFTEEFREKVEAFRLSQISVQKQ